MTEDHLKVGVIGAGMISDYHIRGLREAGAVVAAISSQTEETAQQKAKQFDIPDYTLDYHEILQRDDIAGVVIATPDYTHKPIALDAAKAGKGILLQKPMARNSQECLDIISAAEEYGTPLYVSFMHRYFEEVQRTRELLEEDALGKVFSVRMRNATPGARWAAWFYDRAKVGGGALIQLGVHGIDLLRYLFGEIEAVKATTALMKVERLLDDGSVVRPNSEDLIFALYRFESGMLGVHETVYNEVAGTDRFRMEIYGEEGTAWLRTERGDLAIYAPEYLGHEGWFSPRLPALPLGKRQHAHFLAMLSGEAEPDTSAQDGLATLLVAEAIYRSAGSGGWEEVANRE
jgi:predicted dehydrogenase